MPSSAGGTWAGWQDELKGGGAGEAFALAKAIAGAVTATGSHRLLQAAAPLQKDRKLCREALSRLGVIFRDACVLRAGGKTLLGGAPEEADRLGSLPKKQLVRLAGLPEEYLQKLDRNANMALLVTCLCQSLREAAGR